MERQQILLKLNAAKDALRGSPSLILTESVLKRIQLWTRLAADQFDYEISGMGCIYKRSYGYVVTDVCLIKPQRASGGHVEMDPASIYEVYKKLYEKNINIKHWRFLWHSHVRFDTFFSGTDDHTARSIFCPDAEWTFNLVTNVYGKFKARMDFPLTQEDPLDDIPVKLLLPYKSILQKKWERQYQEEFSSQVPPKHRPENDVREDPVISMTNLFGRPVRRVIDSSMFSPNILADLNVEKKESPVVTEFPKSQSFSNIPKPPRLYNIG